MDGRPRKRRATSPVYSDCAGAAPLEKRARAEDAEDAEALTVALRARLPATFTRAQVADIAHLLQDPENAPLISGTLRRVTERLASIPAAEGKTLDYLPDAVLATIYSYCDLRTIRALTGTCHRLRRFCMSSSMDSMFEMALVSEYAAITSRSKPRWMAGDFCDTLMEFGYLDIKETNATASEICDRLSYSLNMRHPSRVTVEAYHRSTRNGMRAILSCPSKRYRRAAAAPPQSTFTSFFNAVAAAVSGYLVYASCMSVYGIRQPAENLYSLLTRGFLLNILDPRADVPAQDRDRCYSYIYARTRRIFGYFTKTFASLAECLATVPRGSWLRKKRDVDSTRAIGDHTTGSSAGYFDYGLDTFLRMEGLPHRRRSPTGPLQWVDVAEAWENTPEGRKCTATDWMLLNDAGHLSHCAGLAILNGWDTVRALWARADGHHVAGTALETGDCTEWAIPAALRNDLTVHAAIRGLSAEPHHLRELRETVLLAMALPRDSTPEIADAVAALETEEGNFIRALDARGPDLPRLSMDDSAAEVYRYYVKAFGTGKSEMRARLYFGETRELTPSKCLAVAAGIQARRADIEARGNYYLVPKSTFSKQIADQYTTDLKYVVLTACAFAANSPTDAAAYSRADLVAAIVLHAVRATFFRNGLFTDVCDGVLHACMHRPVSRDITVDGRNGFPVRVSGVADPDVEGHIFTELATGDYVTTSSSDYTVVGHAGGALWCIMGSESGVSHIPHATRLGDLSVRSNIMKRYITPVTIDRCGIRAHEASLERVVSLLGAFFAAGHSAVYDTVMEAAAPVRMPYADATRTHTALRWLVGWLTLEPAERESTWLGVVVWIVTRASMLNGTLAETVAKFDDAVFPAEVRELCARFTHGE